ncbi:VPLPA-CTERM sorting domain-containing protein [Tropicimonas sp.]|uniref:VPLPA-CTERM sorting domain-containing protein n=1 Tax=Tropicimonas sp. TaxID=2067044 RepID=UPI003A86D110
MNKTLFKTLAFTVLAAGISTSASALTLNTSYNVSENFARVTVGSPAYNGYAGAFNVTTSEAAPLDSFVAWCLDIGTTIKSSYEYIVKSIDDDIFTNGGSAVSLDDTQKSAIQNLFNTAYNGLDTLDKVQAGGFQLALWEIAYETSGTFSLSDGSFTETNTAGAAARAQANTFLAGLAGGWTGTYDLAFFEAAETAGGHGSQNLVGGFEAAPVPLPAAAWLLLAGMGALGVAGRRKAS